MIPPRTPLAITAAFACLLACGRGGPSSLNAGDFEIELESGPLPAYGWSAGPAFSVTVVRVAEPGRIVWGLAMAGGDIRPPVRHGIVQDPAAVILAFTEGRLADGVRYRVTVVLTDGRTAYREFTP
jgi:hypothetical protein